MVKLTEARRRTLQYMADFDVRVASFGWSTGWTSDQYQWPVNGQVLIALNAAKLIERDPTSNEYTFWRITEAGRAALADGGRDE